MSNYTNYGFNDGDVKWLDYSLLLRKTKTREGCGLWEHSTIKTAIIDFCFEIKSISRFKRREKATIRVNRCDVMVSHSLDTGSTKSYPSESSNSWDTRCPKSNQTECKYQPSFNSTTITSVQLEKRKLNFENCTRL